MNVGVVSVSLPKGEIRGWVGPGPGTLAVTELRGRAHRADFTGRDSDLARLHELLTQPDRGPVAVHGLGGVGKSQLAVEYAWVHSRELPVVWTARGSDAYAIPLPERSTAIDEAHYGADHSEVITDLRALAAALTEASRQDQAAPVDARILAGTTASSADHMLLPTLNTLAEYNMDHGTPAVAADYLERAAEIITCMHGPGDMRMTEPLRSAATAQQAVGRVWQAMHTMAQVVAINGHYGDETAAAVTDLRRLAELQGQLGRTQDAEANLAYARDFENRHSRSPMAS